MTSKNVPEYVSFTDAAQILVRRGLVGSMTPQGLRYIARTRDGKKSQKPWPFGTKPSQEPYLMAGKTRMMRTESLLDHFEKYPPTGRGPAKQPRRAAGTP
ncbi:hypothetical protein [Streptomyces sp. NBC_01483]|uniref:hypothetical protein n=1 Tax=Streptomyces sp. NBC_01483 TaxID=2903883 RepID=UPI002E332707|nr:hypothetical protein [Streptomyces sp. NBC_01483]